MGRLIFIANDPDNRTEATLHDLIPAMDGVVNWEIGPGGEVIIEYDAQVTSAETIEEALAGLDFRVRHIADQSEAAPVSSPERHAR